MALDYQITNTGKIWTILSDYSKINKVLPLEVLKTHCSGYWMAVQVDIFKLGQLEDWVTFFDQTSNTGLKEADFRYVWWDMLIQNMVVNNETNDKKPYIEWASLCKV